MLTSGPATYTIEQKISPLANRYRVLDAGGQLVAFVSQKRLALRERFTVHPDESSSTVLFTVGARQRLDIGATYDVTDASGAPVGLFRKDAGASLLRSTWHIEQPGLPPVRVSERNPVVALVRRFVELPFPLPYHFDGATADGSPALSVSRRMSLRDRYDVQVHLDDLDHRLVIGLGVCLDALQGR